MQDRTLSDISKYIYGSTKEEMLPRERLLIWWSRSRSSASNVVKVFPHQRLLWLVLPSLLAKQYVTSQGNGNGIQRLEGGSSHWGNRDLRGRRGGDPLKGIYIPILKWRVDGEVTHSGLCGTDMHYFEYGQVLGHEGVGVVVEIGSRVPHGLHSVGDTLAWGIQLDVGSFFCSMM